MSTASRTPGKQLQRQQSSPARHCAGHRKDGAACGAYAGEGSAFCLTHDPERADIALAARRKGGQHRRRRAPNEGAAVVPDLGSVAGAQQLLARAARTALACDTSLAQARTLATIALAAAKLLEVGELADQLQELEARASRLAAPRRHLSPMLRIRRS